MANLGPRAYYKLHNYAIRTGQNGLKCVELDSVRKDVLNFSFKNSKTGRVIAFNLPVEFTCNHACECYSKKNCYACGGCYQFSLNQALYSENLKAFKEHETAWFVDVVNEMITHHKSRKLFRWFTCGDIPNIRFLQSMVEIAAANPEMTFWTYTKKYGIVNSWVKQNGLENLPSNLTIVFSHWMNEDGTYFPMYNPYRFPTSEFIPMGKEDLLNTVNHVCPCSDPNSKEHCETCKTPCYGLKFGESMALVEHSTPRTKERDAAIKAAKQSGNMDIDLISFLKSFSQEA